MYAIRSYYAGRPGRGCRHRARRGRLGGIKKTVITSYSIHYTKLYDAEIIMQQTRISQGLPYYLRFMENYPTVAHLAQAHEDEILKLWQGLVV